MLARSKACGKGVAGTWWFVSNGSTTPRKQNPEGNHLMANNLYTAQPTWMKTMFRPYPTSVRYWPQKNLNDAFKALRHLEPGPLCQIACSVASEATTQTTRRYRQNFDLRMLLSLLSSIQGGFHGNFGFGLMAFEIWHAAFALQLRDEDVASKRKGTVSCGVVFDVLETHEGTCQCSMLSAQNKQLSEEFVVDVNYPIQDTRFITTELKEKTILIC